MATTLHKAPPRMPAGGSGASEECVVPAPILWNDGTVTRRLMNLVWGKMGRENLTAEEPLPAGGIYDHPGGKTL